jgi:hypothetical protein
LQRVGSLRGGVFYDHCARKANLGKIDLYLSKKTLEHTMKKLPIGISDYKNLIENNCYYVDKTLLIKELLATAKAVTLIPRPRRFGKTLNLSMLRYFFEKTEVSNSHLFTDKTIWQNEECREEQGQYPVIFLTFKDIKEPTWAGAYAKLQAVIAKEYTRHQYLLELSLTNYEKAIFNALLSAQATPEQYHNSLYFLTDLLYRYHNKYSIVLVDEYDAPIHAAYQYNYYSESIHFIRSLLSAVFKDNRYLKRGVLTGILRTAKEGIFSGLNNLSVCTLLSEHFADKFGFTAPEVDQLLTDQAIAYKAEVIKAWYNGYRVGKQTFIFNPWSILECASNDGELMPYWVNTSSNDLVKKLIARSNLQVKTELESLVIPYAPPLIKKIDEGFIFPGIENHPSALWSLLLFSGYITYARRTVTGEGEYECELVIPNKEIQTLYTRLITDIITQSLRSESLESMLHAFITGNVATFEHALQEFVVGSMSYYDVADTDPERSYHVFILGLLMALKDTYHIKSNREAGLGRYDLMLVPKSKKGAGIIIEFKKASVRDKETLEQATDRAMEQIIAKKYAHEVREHGVDHVLMYAIGIQGKQVLIKMQQE